MSPCTSKHGDIQDTWDAYYEIKLAILPTKLHNAPAAPPHTPYTTLSIEAQAREERPWLQALGTLLEQKLDSTGWVRRR